MRCLLSSLACISVISQGDISEFKILMCQPPEYKYTGRRCSPSISSFVNVLMKLMLKCLTEENTTNIKHITCVSKATFSSKLKSCNDVG